MVPDTRAAILDATDILLERHGYRRITMEAIAQESGVGRRTLYLHFGGRDEVCLACADRIIDGLHRAMQEIAARPDAPTERLRRMLLTRVLFMFDRAQDNYQKYLDLFADVRPAYLARRERYVEEEAARLQAVIEEGVWAGEFATNDAVLTARALLLATNSLMPSPSARANYRRERRSRANRSASSPCSCTAFAGRAASLLSQPVRMGKRMPNGSIVPANRQRRERFWYE